MFPIMPNSNKLLGLQSALAPASTRRDGMPPTMGYTLARAGLSIPCILPKINNPPARRAPVDPAEMNISPSPFLTMLMPFTIEESFLDLTALTGASSLEITCVAFITLIFSLSYLYFLSSGIISSSCPIIHM